MAEDVGIPSNFSSWSRDPPSGSVHFNLSPASSIGPLSREEPQRINESLNKRSQEFFLTHIMMKHNLRRCGTSVALHEGSQRVLFAPIIAKELECQLNGWYDCLPQSMWFNRSNEGTMTHDVHAQSSVSSGPRPGRGVDNDEHSLLPLFLRAQYFSCLASTYWPAAVQAIDGSATILPVQLTAELLDSCSRFLESCVQFIRSANACISYTLHPNMWILHVRLFEYSLAVLRAMSVPYLCCGQRGGISCNAIHSSLEDALAALSRAAHRSDSLALLWEKMNEKMARWQPDEASCSQDSSRLT